jgi:hypothetical protein
MNKVFLETADKSIAQYNKQTNAQKTKKNRDAIENSATKKKDDAMIDRVVGLHNGSKLRLNPRAGLAGAFTSSEYIAKQVQEHREKVGYSSTRLIRQNDDGTVNTDPFQLYDGGEMVYPDTTTGVVRLINKKNHELMIEETEAQINKINSLCNDIIRLGDDMVTEHFKIPDGLLQKGGGAEYCGNSLAEVDATPYVIQSLGEGTQAQALAKSKLFHIAKHFPQNFL